MNIEDFMGGLAPTPALSTESLQELFRIREETFMGFMAREHEKGIMFAPFDLRTSKGQDVARLFFWRCVEEYGESLTTGKREHRLEELIDAFNYASAAFIGSRLAPLTLDELQPIWQSKDSSVDILGRITLKLSGVTETFRNRSWMENSQSSYFDGLAQYRTSLLFVMGYICSSFKDWDEFWRYFMAKDFVLQFRLKSNY